MKKILALLVLLPSTLFADGFIHPLKFNPSTDKEAVIKFIETDVKKTYSEIGMDDPSTLRMMEKENLNAFKELTKVKNAEILDNVINTYCKIRNVQLHNYKHDV